MSFIKSFAEILFSLTLVDYIFFFSMLLLIILVVSLIYFIKINKEEAIIDQPIAINTIEDINDDYSDENDAIIDLESITKALEERKVSPIEMTDYEIEQEERAIISYDELVERSKNLSLNYETESIDSEINIKKVNLENLVNKIEEEKPKLEVRVISYQKEEAFLETLKKLQGNIN